GPQRYRVLKQLLDEYGAQAARDCHDCLAAAIARTVESNEVFSVPTPDAETLKQLLSELVTQKDLYQQVTESETTATDSTAARSSEVAANKKRRDSTCILVIDDEQSIVKLIRLYLQSQPWRV